MSKNLKLFYEDTDGMKVYSANGGLHQLKNIDATMLKKLTALEIIKEKGICLPALKLTASFEKDNLEEYNKICIKHYALPLTQKEYDLLKEVLQNG